MNSLFTFEVHETTPANASEAAKFRLAIELTVGKFGWSKTKIHTTFSKSVAIEDIAAELNLVLSTARTASKVPATKATVDFVCLSEGSPILSDTR